MGMGWSQIITCMLSIQEITVHANVGVVYYGSKLSVIRLIDNDASSYTIV